MHVFMQFEQFCSKDFRDASNLILNRSKMGPITLSLLIVFNSIDCQWSGKENSIVVVVVMSGMVGGT